MSAFLWFSWVLLIVPLLRYNTLFATSADRKEAIELATTIHGEMASGHGDQMYLDADKRFQAAVTLTHHQHYLASIAERLGTPMDCTPDGVAVKLGWGEKSIRLKCNTSFSGGKTAVERFYWTKPTESTSSPITVSSGIR